MLNKIYERIMKNSEWLFYIRMIGTPINLNDQIPEEILKYWRNYA